MGHPSDPVRGRRPGAHRAQRHGDALKPQPPRARVQPQQQVTRATQPGRPHSAGRITRRKLLFASGGVAAALVGLERLDHLTLTPIRAEAAASTSALPDIQYDIGSFLAPAQTLNDGGGNVVTQFGPVHTLFATATLQSRPTANDQAQLADALARIEQAYSFTPQGVFTCVAYGLPYFHRFPTGLFNRRVPRLTSKRSRYVLEEAVPSPTDVSSANPGITKAKFNVPVRIESNDMLFTIRSDNAANTTDVMRYLAGSNSLAGQSVQSPRLSCGLRFTSARSEFVQIGLPRKVANTNNLSFAGQVSPDSPMWMGFLDQQTNGAGPAPITTFAGNSSAHITTAEPGDYFDNGSIQHLSHNIQDLAQFYDQNPPNGGDPETYTERVQYMFRSNPIPSAGNADQFTDGGGPAYLANVFQGPGDAAANAQGVNTFQGEHRMGHLCALQRSSRAADGTPMHIRADGPGFDSMDVPDGSKQPKLQFTAFMPSAEFFREMRANQASLDLVKQFGVDDADNGLERFITATRRQNFLVPPRRHRAFPFAEFAG